MYRGNALDGWLFHLLSAEMRWRNEHGGNKWEAKGEVSSLDFILPSTLPVVFWSAAKCGSLT
jgi:hypothetical protein